MLLRKALMAALVVAPFVYSPSAASAQQRGLDRAAVASEHADEVGAGQQSRAHQDMPRGIVQRFADQVLPPGIRRTRHQEDSAPAAESNDGATDTGTTDTGTTDPGTTDPVCLSYTTVLVGFTVTQVCTLWSN
jgi:hypothetical protein